MIFYINGFGKDKNTYLYKKATFCMTFLYQKWELPKGSQDRTCLPQRKARTAYWSQDFKFLRNLFPGDDFRHFSWDRASGLVKKVF